jgi:hypothetical protein
MEIENSPCEEGSVGYESLLTKQQIEYHHIRDKADSVMQTVLAIISIAISFGFIRFLLSGGAVQRAPIEFSNNLVNRCSAGALTYSNTSLIGLGPTISITAVGLLILSAYLISEMWMANRAVQGMSRSLLPQNEANFWVSNHREWIKYNQRAIGRSSELLSSMKKKLYWSIGLILLAMALIATVYYDRVIVALVVGLLLTLAGVIFVTEYVRRHYFSEGIGNMRLQVGFSLMAVGLVLGSLVLSVWLTHVLLLPLLGGIVVLSALLDSGNFSDEGEDDKMLDFNKLEIQVFHLRDRTLSPVFLSLSTIVLSYLVGKYILISLLINRFLTC